MLVVRAIADGGAAYFFVRVCILAARSSGEARTLERRGAQARPRKMNGTTAVVQVDTRFCGQLSSLPSLLLAT